MRVCEAVVILAALAMAQGLVSPALGQRAESVVSAYNPAEEIETDRDCFTFAPTTAGTGRSIFEASYSFLDNRTGPEAHSFPELLVRRGVSERVELRVGFNYEAGGPGTVSGTEVGGEDLEAEYESRVLYGTKIETSRQEGWMPQSALVVQGYTPTYGPTTQSTVVAGESVGWRFANGWVWGSSMRYGTGFDKEDAFNQWAPSSVLKIPVGERLNVHAEYFAIFSEGKQQALNRQFVSLGGHILLSEDFELGARYGWGLNESSPGFFVNCGLGFRY
jgi:hypothetical protein